MLLQSVRISAWAKAHPTRNERASLADCDRTLVYPRQAGNTHNATSPLTYGWSQVVLSHLKRG